MLDREQEAQENRSRDQLISSIADKLIALIVQCKDIATVEDIEAFKSKSALLLPRREADIVRSVFKWNGYLVFRKALETNNTKLIEIVWKSIRDEEVQCVTLMESGAFSFAVSKSNYPLALLFWGEAEKIEHVARTWLSDLRQQQPTKASEQQIRAEKISFSELCSDMRKYIMFITYVEAFSLATKHKNYTFMKELLELAENNWERWQMLYGAGLKAGKSSGCSLYIAYAEVDKFKARNDRQNSFVLAAQGRDYDSMVRLLGLAENDLERLEMLSGSGLASEKSGGCSLVKASGLVERWKTGHHARQNLFSSAMENKDYNYMKRLLGLAENDLERQDIWLRIGLKFEEISECSLEKSHARVDEMEARHNQQKFLMAASALTPLLPTSSALSSQPAGVVAGGRITPENSLGSSVFASDTEADASTGRTSPSLKRGRDDDQTEWRAKLSKTGTGSQQEEGVTVRS